jgi:putative ABC transport system ATP-binding protein
VLDILFNMVKEQGHTLVMVTHNEAVAGLCERRLALHDGRLAG